MIFLHGGFLCPVEIATAVAAVGGLGGAYWWARCRVGLVWQWVKGLGRWG